MTSSSYNGFPGAYRDAQQRVLVRNWRNGTWPSPAVCNVCGQTEGTLHGHLEDYSRPETFVPLCITCHLVLHCRFRNRLAWQHYCNLVGLGWRAPWLTQSSGFTEVKRTLLDADPSTWPGEWVRTEGDYEPTFLDTLSLTKIVHPASLGV